jgi:hypothetical protein
MLGMLAVVSPPSDQHPVRTRGLLLFPGLGVPLLPLQLLWINLLTDELPAIALGVDPVDLPALVMLAAQRLRGGARRTPAARVGG